MAFVPVQAASIGTDGTTTTTIALTVSAVGAGNLVTGILTWGGATTDLTSITDNKSGGSNTYTIVRRVLDTPDGQCAACFYGYNLAGGPTIITANFGTAVPYRGMSIDEFSGEEIGSAPLDGTNEQGQVQATPGTGTDGASSGTGTLTPSAANYLVWGGSVNTGANNVAGGSEFAAGTNFTEPAGAEYSVASLVSISSEYWIQTTATAANASFTVTQNTPHITFMMVFKVAGGAAAAADSQLGSRRNRPGRGPYSLGRYFRPRVDGFSNPNVAVGLSGQAITSALGTLTPSTSAALSGLAITVSGGTLVAALSKAPSGQAVTSVTGTLTPVVSLALSGQAITSAQGSVSAGSEVTAALTGLQINSAHGTLAPSISLALTGQVISAAQGTLAASLLTTLSGQSIASSAGTLVQSITLALSGQQANFAQGSITTGSDVILALTGQSIESAQGTLAGSYLKGISGVSASLAQGTLTPITGFEVALTGLSIGINQGSLSAALQRGISGQSITISAGSVDDGGLDPVLPLAKATLVLTPRIRSTRSNMRN